MSAVEGEKAYSAASRDGKCRAKDALMAAHLALPKTLEENWRRSLCNVTLSTP